MSAVRLLRHRLVLSCLILAAQACQGAPTAESRHAKQEVVPTATSASAAGPGKAAAVPNRGAINPRLLRRFRPLAQSKTHVAQFAPEVVSLGRLLWYEPRLSKDGRISCNSCHDLSNYGTDHRPTSLGAFGQAGRRNAPTAYNTVEHLAQFWDGRASDLEQQARAPILDVREMAATRTSVESFLRDTPEYRALFRSAFPESREPTLENVAKALGAFERGLVTTSRWDDYLAGNANALSAEEVQGLRIFLEVGCMGCHTGPQMGASMFQVVGFVERWPNQRDQGRFEVTKVPTDRMVFKVPTLKNIARTAPYFHDGSCSDLDDAVLLMGRHQLGIELGEQEVSSIVTFFHALTGVIPHEYIARPLLPGASGELRGKDATERSASGVHAAGPRP